MQCPRCYGTNVSAVGNTHYVCNNTNCVDSKGRRTQFRMVTDDYVRFPYNQIFIGRALDNFYRKPYLELG